MSDMSHVYESLLSTENKHKLHLSHCLCIYAGVLPGVEYQKLNRTWSDQMMKNVSLPDVW